MEKLSHLISKKLFSFSDAASIGYVLNVAFDEKFNMSSLIVADEENDRELSVKFDKVVMCEDNIFVESTNQLSRATEQADRIIGKSVFTNKGVYCGKVNEVYLSKKAVVSLETDMLSFSPSNVGARGDIIVLGKIAKVETENAFLPQSDEQKVQLMIGEEAKDEVEIPYRVGTNPNNLIGKMATKDIFGLNNEILLKKYEIITQKKLIEIKKHNKLNILFYNCK